MSAPGRLTIVGSGLAGSLLALELVERGLAVTLIDAEEATATAFSYGGVAWWAGAPGPLGPLLRQAPARWRRLQERHGPLGWRRCGLRLHGGGWGSSQLRPPFAQVDTAVLMAALPRVLAAAGVERRRGRVMAPPQPVAAGWQLELESGDPLLAEQVVLAAGAGCRFLAPALPVRLRASWAGVLAQPIRAPLSTASASPWLRHAARRRIVQPRHWQRPALEAAAPGLEEERWIVDAGFAPWGEGLLLGQISLVRPGLDSGEPPPAAAMEEHLRQGLTGLDPLLAALPGPFRQVPVAFCSNGLPLAGPLPGAAGLWVFSGFGGAFAQVPVLAPVLADVIAGVADPGGLARFGVLPG
ncbi:FAD-binding oxidoreductase [Cyanobium sp. Cruz CV13-4-11]|uniref:NAD(P)/FAD-dependent oxidoreductase n=1 Tax=unclassified Cyanobium TaxID=2627006 RepID=UPI0020CCBBC6|nr:MULTISPECIES: FAD-binding oxidoreductase [unclassified Cyanobium]MCP9901056.1 FAD-binding oxidoreductase [Cyanobium sp. Cruz CV11-17]MCP9920022.1 FAD-binding oxidoreductase [Cyanobium sp. Cruz CV13-4-11]